jgi:hypothetical protein
MSCTIGGKEYEYKKADLGLMRKAIQIEVPLDIPLSELLKDDEKFNAASNAWREYCLLVMTAPDEAVLDYGALTFGEIKEVREGFFVHAVGTVPKPAA